MCELRRGDQIQFPVRLPVEHHLFWSLSYKKRLCRLGLVDTSTYTSKAFVAQRGKKHPLSDVSFAGRSASVDSAVLLGELSPADIKRLHRRSHSRAAVPIRLYCCEL